MISCKQKYILKFRLAKQDVSKPTKILLMPHQYLIHDDDIRVTLGTESLARGRYEQDSAVV